MPIALRFGYRQANFTRFESNGHKSSEFVLLLLIDFKSARDWENIMLIYDFYIKFFLHFIGLCTSYETKKKSGQQLRGHRKLKNRSNFFCPVKTDVLCVFELGKSRVWVNGL
ncbi:CLUMA_CG010496, isoform A [Clunio marinus]|uniref:CLUMA_CG010496, isoform A n=1 Tax=Clunio marinus TaxID=568069 RepID=A0A1J1IF46_9DIPT|nr:CLUMA_CG010496, isoform A [Clunio marinus]